MWRKRRGSLGGGNARESPNVANSNSLTSMPSSMSITSSSPFFGSDPKANDRALVFRLEVPSPGPLGLDLRARHIERDKPQRGAVVKGFRPLQGGKQGYVESTGRVKVGDILQIIHKTPIDDMPFEQIVKHAMQLQKDPTAWPLAMEFRREPERHEPNHSTSSKPRRNSFFRSSISMSNPVQDGNFNEKLQYFRDFFATRIPTGGAAPKEKEKPPRPPKWDTVDEMYRELMVKRGVPEDVMDELIRIESLETKWHVVWYAQQNENEDNTKSNATEAEKFAENLVELKWDNKGLKDLEALRSKISIASADWLEAFLAHFGLDYLTMKLPDPSPFPIEHSKYEKATRICEVILRILRSLTHFTAGVEAMTNTPGLVKRVALCFHTENGDVKKYTLQLLGIVCYNSAAGHTAVIEAFDHYKETKGESIRFSCLRDALKSTRYSLVFKEDVLSFVNIIVNKAIRLEDRLAIRSDFMALKMAGYFEEIRAKSLAVQRTKYPLASSAASASSEESANGAPSPVPGAPATPSPIPNKHIARNTPSPALSSRSTESPVSGRGKGPGTPIGRLDTLKSFGGRRSSISKGTDDHSGGRLSASKSAPPSPIDREPATLSPDGAIVRSSLPLENKAGPRFGNGGNSIISSSVTQLRNQLDNMEKQIDVFEQFMEDDRKDTIYEQTDLASVDSVYRSLFDSVTNDPELQACFLSILQQLLFIPGDRVIGKEMWALSEKVVKQITLLAPVEEVRNFELGYDDRKTLLKMRDRYAQFLQKCADEDPTFQFRMGPIILIDNKDRDHDDLALSDIIAEETDEEDTPASVVANEHPELLKYFKLLKMGMPMQHVQLKMSSELQTFDPSILETPDKIIQLSKPETEEKKGTRAEEHDKYAKFFKLKKMGMPMAHIELKMSAEGLDSAILETPDLLLDEDGNEVKEGDGGFAGIPVKEHEKFAKFFKLLKMGMPLEHVQLKASSEGLDGSLLSTPDQLLDEEGKVFVAEQSKQEPQGIPVKEHEKFAKFFKLMKMGMPLEHIKLKASAEGLDGELLSTPDALLNEDGSKFVPGAVAVKGVPVKEHEKFAKFFKLMKMGMPLEHIKLKASAEGLDGELLSTPDVLVDEDGKKVDAAAAEQPKGTPVKDHEKFAKFFKLLKMGMPMEHVKLKASAEGLDANLLETPDKLVDEDGKEVKGETPVPKGVPVKEHEKFAKFFKLMKMGMPLPHIKLKAASEGLDGDLLDTPDMLVDEDGKEIKAGSGKKVKASEHPSYVKYFKLLKMGMPRPQLELKMSAESLDPKVLDTPDEMIPEDLTALAPKAPAKPVVTGPPKPKLRNLYWEAVKSEETAGTIWESFAKEEEEKKKTETASAPAGPPSVADLFAARAKTQQPKPAVPKKDKVLDKFVDQLSDIFVNKPAKAKESEAKKPTKRRAPTRVALIDAKRANNIGIMLARFRLPYYKLRNAVLVVDKELLSVERVSALLQFAPEDEELDAVRGYTGDPKLLGDAEQYFREMICIPRLTTRLQAIHATWQFDTYVEEQRKLMESVANACREIQACEPLKEIFRVVLSLGNALNDGTARGGAKGFKLNILLKLNQVKAADNSINLLNYVAKVLRAKDPSILEFDKSLPSIESASRVTTQVLKAGESAVRKAANLICNELEVHAKLPEKEYPQPDPVPGSDEEPEVITDRFQEVVKPFADRAKKSSEQIAEDLESMTKRFEDTASFYGEDPSSPDCGPDAFFSIFYSFAKVLQSADRDNERKRIAEERRIRREEETKKRLEQLKLKKKKSSFATLKTGDVDDIVSKIRAKRVEEKRREMLANGSAPPSSTGSIRGSASAPRSSTGNNSLTAAASEVPTPAMEAV
ncbi:Formin-like protein 20 [Phytophthora citrophthora]|uniref:Formin-like protein 20 n=1 Tax=Phytophthora citrophthora TaxID=4793 RepID=A0AAD9G9T9_9STRA|nr:Formin-like protein 20 [Phytophthora citrophthora]